MALEQILERIENKKVIILGFGKEGVSTYRFIRRHFPKMKLVVADGNGNLNTDDFAGDKHVKFIKGEGYDQNLNQYDLIFKSPGISFNKVNYYIENERITSQTNLFLEFFHEQVVGITGTKGKSTTASLIYHILIHSRENVFLAGNIGTPFFDIVEQLTPESIVVAELSAHQLEFTHHSPDYAVLLNIYQEHLDHFNSFNNYQNAKTNVFKFQHAGNFLVYNGDDEHIPGWVKGNKPESDTCIFGTQIHPGLHARCHNHLIRFMNDGEIVDEYDLIDYKNLPGTHNYFNIMAAIAICRRLGVKHKEILDALLTFKGLPHRILQRQHLHDSRVGHRGGEGATRGGHADLGRLRPRHRLPGAHRLPEREPGPEHRVHGSRRQPHAGDVPRAGRPSAELHRDRRLRRYCALLL